MHAYVTTEMPRKRIGTHSKVNPLLMGLLVNIRLMKNVLSLCNHGRDHGIKSAFPMTV